MMDRSLLPPDLRKQLSEREAARAHRGIGGAAKENAEGAAARAHAIGAPPAEAPADVNREGPAAPASASLPNCGGCRAQLDSEWNFCAKCGRDLVADRDPVKWLGIKPFVDDEVQEWLFRGYL